MVGLMIRRCGWCRKLLGLKLGRGGTTHGICKPCAEKLKQEARDQSNADQETGPC